MSVVNHLLSLCYCYLTSYSSFTFLAKANEQDFSHGSAAAPRHSLWTLNTVTHVTVHNKDINSLKKYLKYIKLHINALVLTSDNLNYK